ncbi:DUF6875 domain-containing protein [Streptomyces sp. NPDC050803]|uniref:DUF6875 domain-containing protein n=1 Tax=unclassified Streptomyces TaxID=2593676 RepID=UPI003411FE79
MPAPRPLRAVPPRAPDAVVWRRVADWAETYLTGPHAELGRPGPVCPFVAGALARDGLQAAVWPHRPTSAGQVAMIMRAYRDWFLRHGRSSAVPDRHRALCVLFPAVPRADVAWAIDGVQRTLKSEFAEQGLMIGEFHDGPPPAPGLWNAGFRPLHSPVPMLVIRLMVPSDLPFLSGDPRHLAAYRARYGTRSAKAER